MIARLRSAFQGVLSDLCHEFGQHLRSARIKAADAGSASLGLGQTFLSSPVNSAKSESSGRACRRSASKDVELWTATLSKK
jgi:hypothetical protein